MPLDLSSLLPNEDPKPARLLVEADLSPIQGQRFQPTGFPDLGAAVFETADGGRRLLVESAQSMANRLEAACWDESAESGRGAPCAALRGLPYVRSTIGDGVTTTSILEAHRLNSPYIVNSKEFSKIEEAIGFKKDRPFDRRRLVQALFRYDPSSLLHGCFLEKIGGTVRLPRALSAFIEADQVRVAASGGVKNDRVQPATEDPAYGKAEDGYGNVPFHRDEYTAGRIVAYFSVDLAQIRGYGLKNTATELLVGLALYKILAFLDADSGGLRLRTACDLRADAVRVTAPKVELPSLASLREALPALIDAARRDEGIPDDHVPFEVRFNKESKAKKG